ncbi:DNA adenine methylase [Clostridium perfringens]|uniref:DNA adenine methylase n=1 Tax=Clostridium perfringens TaxID=1502 RepID=UPI00103DBF30|nr:DNA adenine methylase [Clostridium perfringens]MBO3323092.1 DNA adenine methylase [Clostridium perfringens]MBO3332256.1 DNA adenine methylase [Clostridium perfringens]MCR1964820.1 DNA adenine methylase [Clostridium perfringens]MDM0506253.1 DNA adenine methylase [Clostridium perfringens]MDM0615423.1 DNA adenine methylase [Clostridium perfringens]
MNYIKSCLNYTGGKYKLLSQIMPLIPNECRTFIDMFCGGCNVGINIKAEHIIFNDKLEVLIGLYETLLELDEDYIFSKIEEIIKKYNLSDTYNKGYAIYDCDSSQGLSRVNKEAYQQLRLDYNMSKPIVKEQIIEKNLMLYTLSVYGFNNQIRFNKEGNYNIPVGKRDFNQKVREKLKVFIRAIKEKNISFINLDFKELDLEWLNENDFVYADPPYRITTASYNENNGWGLQDDLDLFEYLDKLDKKGIRFAMSNVIEHNGSKNNELIEWSKKYKIHYLNFNYNNSNYQSKAKKRVTKEVLITNY